MKKNIKKIIVIIKRLILKALPEILFWMYRKSDFYQHKLVKKWERPGNPHLIKENTIIELRNYYNVNFFLETGTLHGEMVYRLKNYFQKLISIELDMNLYCSAKRRLRKYSNIEILHGDSGEILPKIINKIPGPCIFWLDAHFSGGNTAKGNKDTPIEEELNTILSQTFNHIILIDDARCFGNLDYPDYPSIRKIERTIISKKPDYKFHILGDFLIAYENNSR